jgi:DNA invertase Pin-like site-specific DNA recombinase
MEDIVVYLRVSTEEQDYNRQLIDLENWASGRFNIIKVFAEKLSGLDDERPQLILLKQYLISNPNIKIIATWELSRVSRKKSFLFTFFEWCAEREINLFLYKQNLWLLDSDKKINSQIDLQLTLLSYFAQSEVMMMRERIKSKMNQLKSEGKFLGGQIAFGYKLDKNNRYIKDEVNAEIVADLFQFYNRQGESLITTAQYILMKYNINITKSRLRNILRRDYYRGIKAERIVSDELFNSVQLKLTANQTKAKGAKKKQGRLLDYLIKCPYCGGNFSSKTTTDMYCCSHSPGYGIYEPNNICHQSVGISCNHIDSIIWRLLKYILYNNDDFFEKLNQESDKIIETLSNECFTITDNINKLKNQIKKENIKLDAESIDIETFKSNIKKLNEGIKSFESEIKARNEKIDAITKNKNIHSQSYSRYEYIDSIKEYNSIKDLIKDYIEEINIYKVGNKRSERKIKVKFYNIEQPYYLYRNMCSRSIENDKYAFYAKYDFTDFEFNEEDTIPMMVIQYKLLNFTSLKIAKNKSD